MIESIIGGMQICYQIRWKKVFKEVLGNENRQIGAENEKIMEI